MTTRPKIKSSGEAADGASDHRLLAQRNPNLDWRSRWFNLSRTADQALLGKAQHAAWLHKRRLIEKSGRLRRDGGLRPRSMAETRAQRQAIDAAAAIMSEGRNDLGITHAGFPQRFNAALVPYTDVQLQHF